MKHLGYLKSEGFFSIIKKISLFSSIILIMEDI